jgi:hypothetical protein
MIIERKEEITKKPTKVEVMKKVEAQRERDHELITGIFKFHDFRGGTLRFRFKKYAGDDFKEYALLDGERYQLPRMVARHINQNVHYLEYKHLPGENGAQGMRGAYNNGHATQNGSSLQGQMYATDKIPRCEFRSLEFMDDDLDMIQAPVTAVQKA